VTSTTFLLIRHGHTAQNGPGARLRMSGITDFRLSDVGRREAHQLARFLAARSDHFASICMSPLSRARDTALALVAAGLGEPVTVEDLREIDCGAFEGLELELVKRRHPDLWAANLRQDDEDFRWPRGESYRAFRTRCLGAVRELAARHRGERIAVVTHAGVVSQIVGSIAGTSAARWDLHRPGNTAVTELHWEGDTGTIARFDDRSHLVASAPHGVGTP
jgi:broad specificity phosphatase PhoE